MQFLAIDIETTGLDPELHDILEFAAVWVDTSIKMPVQERPSLNLITPNESENYFVTPYCALLHKDLWEIISSLNIADVAEQLSFNESITLAEGQFCFPRQIPDCLVTWLEDTVKLDLSRPITLAGKNIQKLDLPFLLKDGYWDNLKFRHRVLDPGSMYARPEAEAPPSLDEIVATLPGRTPGPVTHRALQDCWDVVQAIEAHWNEL